MMRNGSHERQLIVSSDSLKNLLVIKTPNQHWKIYPQKNIDFMNSI